MKLKAALLFWVILIAFFGCRKSEKAIKVHELNIGATVIETYDKVGNKNWDFQAFWHIDLAQDSIFRKINTYKFGLDNTINIEGGKLTESYKKAVLKFIEANLKNENFKTFQSSTAADSVFNHNLWVVEYKKGASSKYYLFQEGNKSFSDFIKILDTLNLDKYLAPINPSKNLNEGHFLKNIIRYPNFSLLQNPHYIQKTIKFTPPIKNQKDLDSILRNNK